MWSETECKTPAEYGLHHNSTPPFSLGRGGEEVREKVEGQQYTNIVPSSMGAATFHKLGRKYQPRVNVYLQSIKSVKHNAAKSVNRSILKKS
jgi:hypothetical protein